MNTVKRLLSLMCVMICLIFNIKANAHEIYYEQNSSGLTPIILKWNPKIGNKCYLKLNADTLNRSGNFIKYENAYDNVKNLWNNVGGLVSVYETDIETSNVDLATATEAAWSAYTNGDIYSALGYNLKLSTDNYQINSLANAKICSGYIKYASVIISPHIGEFGPLNSNEANYMMRYTIVHELGHVLCLGHSNDSRYYPSSAASVMRTYIDEATYYAPQNHDINDIINKYS